MANSDKKEAAPLRIKTDKDFSALVEALCSLKNGSTAA